MTIAAMEMAIDYLSKDDASRKRFSAEQVIRGLKEGVQRAKQRTPVGQVVGAGKGEPLSDQADLMLELPVGTDLFATHTILGTQPRILQAGMWHALTDVGQVKVGDGLRMRMGDAPLEAKVHLVLSEGTPDEEVIYDRRHTHYFHVALALAGNSSHRCIEFRPQKSLLQPGQAEPAVSAQALRDSVLWASIRSGHCDQRTQVWTTLREMACTLGLEITKDDQYNSLRLGHPAPQA